MQQLIDKVVESLRDVKTQINMELAETNFESEDLARLSIAIQQFLDEYDHNRMSERNRSAYDCRHTLNEAFKKIEKLERRMASLQLSLNYTLDGLEKIEKDISKI